MTVKAFLNPTSAQEAVALMNSQPGRGAFLAGGTDLLCERKGPDFVVNVRDLLRHTKLEGDQVVVGASATLSQLEDWAELRDLDDGLLHSCALAFGSRHIRNMATLGGNLATAVPSADLALPLLVLDAECVILDEAESRTVPLADFFTAPRQCVLDKALLVEVRFGQPVPGTKTAFLKACPNPGAIAVVNVAALLVLDGDAIKTARIALGAVAPTPIRAREAEAYLEGKTVDVTHFERAAELAQAATAPITDQRAEAQYRKHMAGVLTRRALEQCLREPE